MKENLFKDFYNRGFLEDKKNNVSVNGLKMLFDFLEELIEGKIKLDDELNEFEVMAKAVKEDELILKIKNYYENRGNDYNILKQESLKIIQSNDEITAKKIAEFYERVKENKLLDIIGLRFKIDNENNDLNELLFKISNYHFKFKISDQVNDEDKKNQEEYNADKFLEEVFMTRDKYDILVKLLKNKKNIILQGAPGVGKTYAAKRLAYSLIGRKDEDKIKMIQFHQNYSYEDFIMGFRPEEDGSFKLRNGIFHSFCSKASKDKENAYYFIIDEINRGNLSKIFGELLMLIESDKRGVEFSVPLTYKQEEDFHVPENVHIIGMMNTADRSLAIMDYALRRRFCFIEIEPAFKIKEFENHLRNSILHEGDADKIIKKMIGLNKEIEEDSNLGKGFKIGHSYFCNPSREEDWYKNIIEYEINPLIEEYWFDDDEKVAQIKKMISDSNGN